MWIWSLGRYVQYVAQFLLMVISVLCVSVLLTWMYTWGLLALAALSWQCLLMFCVGMLTSRFSMNKGLESVFIFSIFTTSLLCKKFDWELFFHRNTEACRYRNLDICVCLLQPHAEITSQSFSLEIMHLAGDRIGSEALDGRSSYLPFSLLLSASSFCSKPDFSFYFYHYPFLLTFLFPPQLFAGFLSWV